jgi:hypothetical protein
MKTPANAAGRWQGSVCVALGSGGTGTEAQDRPGKHQNSNRRRPRPPQAGQMQGEASLAPVLPTEIPARQGNPPADWSRFDRGGEHLHRLGPRAVAEFIAELARAHGIEAAALDRLEAWRAWPVTPAQLRRLGADRCPIPSLHLVTP